MSAPAERRRRTLCVTADDLGYSSARDAGILACAARRGGLVTRASVLVTGASAAAACTAAMAAGLPLGLHLNLSEGAPAASPLAAVASLVDAASGRMRGKLGLRAACAAGAVEPAHLEAEIGAQLDLFERLQRAAAMSEAAAEAAGAEVEAAAAGAGVGAGGAAGFAPAHIDGHQHVHVLPAVREALLRVLAARGVGVGSGGGGDSARLRTRVPQLPPPLPARRPEGGSDGSGDADGSNDAEGGCSSELLALVEDAGGARRAFYEAVSLDAAGLRAALRGGRGAAPRAFAGFSTMGAEGTAPRVRAALRRAFQVADAAAAAAASGGPGAPQDEADADVEWMVHPGLRTPDGLAPAEAGCGGLEADDFARSEEREAEMRMLAPAPGGGRCELRAWVEGELGAELVA